MQFLDRLKEKVQKENLWFFILVLLATEDRYGYELRGLIKTKFGFWSGNVTAYRVLYDLETAKLVRSESQDRRRYYRITEAGRKEVEEARAFLESVLRESSSFTRKAAKP